jgi:hypothetical protein
MENPLRASQRSRNPEAPNPILNHGLELPSHEYWTLTDFSYWTGVGSREIVQAMVFGLCRQESPAFIEKVLRDGGLTVRDGKKEPLP